jgi:hypothetical protein
MPVGRNNGKIKEKRNKILIRGTPRIVSMNIVQITRMIGREERLPRANITPNGNDRVIPPIARNKVTNNPPHRLSDTISSNPRNDVPCNRTRLRNSENNQVINIRRGVILLNPDSK